MHTLYTTLLGYGIDLKLLVVEVIGFGLFLWLMNNLVVKKVFTTLDQRQSDIKSTYDQLDADRAAMDKARTDYEQRLAGIENDARERIQSAVKEAQELRGSIIAEAKQQAETILESGKADMERERTRTFLELRQQVVDLAMQAAERVVGESMNDERQRRLVDQFISGVGAEPAAAARYGGVAGNGSSPTGVA